MMRPAFQVVLLALLLGTLSPQAAPWPGEHIPKPSSGKFTILDPEGEIFRYSTVHYRVHSTRELNRSWLEKFTRSAESVAVVLESIPLPLHAPPTGEKPIIFIAGDDAAYKKAGGQPGTAGYYDGWKKRVILNWSAIQAPANSTNLIATPAFDLLVHELVHLGMHRHLWKCETWLTEGVAEYFAAAHVNKGHFKFSGIERSVRDHIRERIPRGEKTVQVLKIGTLIGLDSKNWMKRIAKLEPNEVLRAYNSSLLLTHYCFHGGEKRRNRVKKYFEALAKVKYVKDKRPVIFEAGEANLIEKQLVKYWSTRGLRLVFE